MASTMPVVGMAMTTKTRPSTTMPSFRVGTQASRSSAALPARTFKVVLRRIVPDKEVHEFAAV